MVSVYFNTTLDGYYLVTVSIFFAGKKIVSIEVLLTYKALTGGHFPLIRKF